MVSAKVGDANWKKAGEIMLSRKIDIWLKSSNHYQNRKVENG